MANYDVGEIQIPHKIFGSKRISRTRRTQIQGSYFGDS